MEQDGQPAIRRITDAKSAYNIFSQMMVSQQGSAIFRGLIKNLVDGNRPYNEAEQKRKGRGWESNVNTGEARASRDQKVLSYWKLINEVPYLCMFFDGDNYQQLGTEDIDRTEAESIIAEEFTNMIRQWRDWTMNMMLMLEEFVTYGFGPMVFPIVGQFPKAMLAGNLLVPLYTKTSLKQLELTMVRDQIPPHHLFELIGTPDNKKRAKSIGWNPDMVEEALKFATRAVWKEDATQTSIWESYAMRAKANDLVMTSQVPTVRIVQVLVREVHSKQLVSHYIFFEDNNLDDFLYKNEDAYESIDKMLWVAFYDNGGGYWRNVKGYGHRIYNMFELANRSFNGTMNAGLLAGSMVLKMTGESAESFAATRFGPFTLVPRNFEPVQQSFQPNLKAMTDMRQMMLSILNNNEGIYKAQQEVSSPTPRTAREVQIEAMNDSRIEANQVEYFYAQMDFLYKMMFARTLDPKLKKQDAGGEEARKFIERCMDRGVPKKMLDADRFIVVASRSIGNGSPVMRDTVSSELVNLSPSFPEHGRWNALRDRVASLPGIGYHMVNRYMQPYKLEANKDEHSSVARLENVIMTDNFKPALVAANQPHVVHGMEHLSILDAMAQQWHEQADMDVIKTAQGAMLVMQHLNDHLQYLFADTARQKALKGILDHVKQIAPVIQEIRKEAGRQQKEQQERQQAEQQKQGSNLTADQQAAFMKVQGDLKIKLMKEQANEKMKWTKLMSDMQRKDKMVDAQIALNEKKQMHAAGTFPITPMVPMPQGPLLPQPGVRP